MSLYSKLFAITISLCIWTNLCCAEKDKEKKILRAYLGFSGRLENRMGS